VHFRSSRRSTFVFNNRTFDVDPGVFDPVRHLSGVVFATHLLTCDFTDTRVLEVGTGCGVVAAALHDGGAFVVATDIDPRSVDCATRNLRGTGIDVRGGDLFESVLGDGFDMVVMNPPYEVGRSRRPTLRSPDVLDRLAREWAEFAPELRLAFPTDSIATLRAAGIHAELRHRLPTKGRELGVFVES
jgi:methylase of polypeptide subunit release factors